MNRNENRKEHYYPGRYISFIAGKEAYDPPIERLKRQKRLKSLVSYDPIVVEYRWVDCLSDTEERKEIDIKDRELFPTVSEWRV